LLARGMLEFGGVDRDMNGARDPDRQSNSRNPPIARDPLLPGVKEPLRVRRTRGLAGAVMPEVVFTGPAGRLEGRYQPAKTRNAPIAIVLHPHPQFGGTMNNQIAYQLFYMFARRGFAVLRFNFRGVGRSQGSFD